jgi:hypothetical protein
MSTLLNDIPDDIVLIDITPQVYTHRLLTIKERVRHTSHLTQHYIRYRPRIAVLLQRADVEPDRLLDDVVLAVGDEEGPVREMHDGRHYDDACEKGSVVEELAGEAD